MVKIGHYLWRKLYNQCVAFSREKKNRNKKLTIKDLREMITKRKPKWLDDIPVPYEVLDGSIRDFMKAVTSNMAKREEELLKGNDFTFRINFRSKRSTSLSMYIKNR